MYWCSYKNVLNNIIFTHNNTQCIISTSVSSLLIVFAEKQFWKLFLTSKYKCYIYFLPFDNLQSINKIDSGRGTSNMLLTNLILGAFNLFYIWHWMHKIMAKMYLLENFSHFILLKTKIKYWLQIFIVSIFKERQFRLVNTELQQSKFLSRHFNLKNNSIYEIFATSGFQLLIYHSPYTNQIIDNFSLVPTFRPASPVINFPSSSVH